MTKELTALKIRGNLGGILEEVYYRGQEFIIKRGKKPMAVLVSVEEFENFKKQRTMDIAIFDKIRSKAKAYPSGKIKRDIEEAVQAVRKGA